MTTFTLLPNAIVDSYFLLSGIESVPLFNKSKFVCRTRYVFFNDDAK